ncbi:MAG: DUF1905 domain-containing protein [Clostridiaceae bacterium]|nr:DUF1905 domain-containing protein [Clostridiaceae bacterium]
MRQDMGMKNEEGSVCNTIGIRKDTRKKSGKEPGDKVKVSIKERM